MRYFLLFTILICFNKLTAQAPLSHADTANLDCSLNLKDSIFHDIHIDTLSYAKSPLPPAFKDVKYKDDDSYDANCTGPDHNKCLNNASSLIYYAFYPKDHNYSGAPLKPIVFVHGEAMGNAAHLSHHTK